MVILRVQFVLVRIVRRLLCWQHKLHVCQNVLQLVQLLLLYVLVGLVLLLRQLLLLRATSFNAHSYT